MINLLKNSNRLAGLVLLLFLLVLLGYVTELPFMMNYLEVSSFWRLGLLSGAVLGILAGLTISRKLAHQEDTERLQVFFATFFFFLLAIPLLLSWTNRIATPPATPTTITIESELARYGDRFGQPKGKTASANTYVLFFILDQQLYRVSGKQSFFPDAQPGDHVRLNLSEGRWGYRWVARPKD